MNQDTLLILYMAVFLGAMYFLFVVPQRKQRKQMAELLASLTVGDEIITAGGIYGAVREVGDDTVDVEVSRDVVVKIAKSAVVARTPAGKAEE